MIARHRSHISGDNPRSDHFSYNGTLRPLYQLKAAGGIQYPADASHIVLFYSAGCQQLRALNVCAIH